jgi:peptidoglycan/xylan/chitin deacetylase (PgdA/CDA1 family)
MMNQAIKDRIKKIIPKFLLLKNINKGDKKSVLLTFDDGPDANVTLKVLEKLNHANAKAVFFIVGKRVEHHAEILRSIESEGHLIGNHTYFHHNNHIPSFIKYWKDISKCTKKLHSVLNREVKLFRPPSGRINYKSILLPLIFNMKVVHWSLGVKDWKCKTSHDATVAAGNILKQVKDKDIILLHDDNKYILNILDMILPELITRGYDLKNGIEQLR